MTGGKRPTENEHGIWVLDTGEQMPASVTDELLQQIREERDLANLGRDAFGLCQKGGKGQ